VYVQVQFVSIIAKHDHNPNPDPNANLNSACAHLQVMQHNFETAHIDKSRATSINMTRVSSNSVEHY